MKKPLGFLQGGLMATLLMANVCMVAQSDTTRTTTTNSTSTTTTTSTASDTTVVPAPVAASPARNTEYHGEFGVRFMPTMSSFDVRNASNGLVEGSFVVGPGFGALLALNFNEHVGMQGEVIYTNLSQKYQDNGLERRINISYINIPLLLSLNTGRSNPFNLNIVAGPQVGINVGSEMEVDEGAGGVDTLTAVLAVKQGDLGIAYGAGIDFGLNAEQNVRLALGFRGVYGLIDVSDKSQNITTNSYYVLDRAHVRTYAGYIGLSFLF